MKIIKLNQSVQWKQYDKKIQYASKISIINIIFIIINNKIFMIIGYSNDISELIVTLSRFSLKSCKKWHQSDWYSVQYIILLYINNIVYPTACFEVYISLSLQSIRRLNY